MERISIITPCFNERDNLPVFYGKLKNTLSSLKVSWEWIVIDDHSTDGSFEVVRDLIIEDQRVRSLRLAYAC